MVLPCCPRQPLDPSAFHMQLWLYFLKKNGDTCFNNNISWATMAENPKASWDSWLKGSAKWKPKTSVLTKVLQFSSLYFYCTAVLKFSFQSSPNLKNKIRVLLLEKDSIGDISLRRRKFFCWPLPEQGNSEENLKYLSQFILGSVVISRVFKRMHKLA